MKIFYSYEQVKEAVRVIKMLMDPNKSLPDVLVKSYRNALAGGYRGVIIKFYELLSDECPEALHYFADVAETEKRDERRAYK